MISLELLTNDAKFLLTSMYKLYIDRRKSGMSKEDALYFSDVEYIHKHLMPEWTCEDVEFTIFELNENKLVVGVLADSTLYNVTMTTQAVALLEKTFADKVDSVLEFAAKVKNAIPFL